jgi:hypothetical protein
MRKVQIEIELTDKQVNFLKNLELLSFNQFIYIIDDYDMYIDLCHKGVISEYDTANYLDTINSLTDIGVQIKMILNEIKNN